MWRAASAWIGLTVLVLSDQWPAFAQPLDPTYAGAATRQREPVARYVRRLVWPVLTAPALARQGGRIQALVLWPGRAPSPAPGDWRVTLTRAAGTTALALAYPARVVRCHAREGFLELEVEVPAELARAVYHLTVVGPGIDDTQPNAVRVFGAEPAVNYRIAVIADHQLWDPSYRLEGRELNGRAYPRRDKESANLSIAKQGLAELSLHDPDFVLHLGDLGFGLDYQAEYQQLRQLLLDAHLPMFAVPGNHDGYAEYSVHLRGGALRLLSGSLSCKRTLAGELTWGKAWSFITCVYGDVRGELYTDLRRDGMSYWRRQFGPPSFSFEHGKLRFVGLNTYDGTPERRHAFSLYLDVFDLKLGFPAVDNHGGYLGREQLEFLRREAASARRHEQILVVFGHHDPRGNLRQTRYHPNQPFPTDPLALNGFEEWNFDSADWDSNPRDGRPAESLEHNSAVELLGILAESGGYYLSGHLHQDQRSVFEPGSALGPFRVSRRLEFIRTTSAASSVRENSYWGYRLIDVRGGRLESVDYAPSQQLSSVPAGNLWLERRRANGENEPDEVLVHYGLPLPTMVTLDWDLAERVDGYRFRAADLPSGALRVREASTARGRAIYRLGLKLPGARIFPPAAGGSAVVRLFAIPARGNSAPLPRLDVALAGGQPLPVGKTLQARVGQPLLLSAERSTDPQGDRIVVFLWDLGAGHSARGQRVAHTFESPGRRTINLTLVDEAGARSHLVAVVNVEPPAVEGCAGCCAPRSRRNGAATAAVPLLLLLLARRAASRRRPRR